MEHPPLDHRVWHPQVSIVFERFDGHSTWSSNDVARGTRAITVSTWPNRVYACTIDVMLTCLQRRREIIHEVVVGVGVF